MTAQVAIPTILMVLALVLFGIATVLEKTNLPLRLAYAGLAAWALSLILGGVLK